MKGAPRRSSLKDSPVERFIIMDTNLTNNHHSRPLLELRNLCKAYQEGETARAVLADVNATVLSGEFAVLLGPSGSGKSTLLNLISGIDVPSSGDVLIGSTNLTVLSEKERTLFRRKNIGLVFQFFSLLPTLTVLENLLLPLDLNGITGKAAKGRAMKLLNIVGLVDRAGSFPDRLSGGEQQRVAIARALVHDPPLVLADEPTGNLDSDTGNHVMGLLEDLARQSGKTIVVVTHRTEAVSLADRVLLVREGRLEEIPAEDIPLRPSPANGKSRKLLS
jgi:putative ABC transport system ATP-binding protein